MPNFEVRNRIRIAHEQAAAAAHRAAMAHEEAAAFWGHLDEPAEAERHWTAAADCVALAKEHELQAQVYAGPSARRDDSIREA